MKNSFVSLTFLSLLSTSLARPAPVEPVPTPQVTPAPALDNRDLIGDLEGLTNNLLGGVIGEVDNVLSSVKAGKLVGTKAWSSISSALTQVTATATQTDAAKCIATLSSIHAAKPSANLYEFVASVAAEGLTANSVTDILGSVDGLATGENGMNNVNPNPKTTIYPKVPNSNDPKYSASEASLRGAIYIPSSSTWGKKQPVILMPGTGATGYFTYIGNYIPLLSGAGYDPVWLNIPGYLLSDAQVNAEYAAYAINYIASVTGKKPSIIGWSQGNINIQWAFKYFTTTQNNTRNQIAISPDYAGTANANLICPAGLPCDPAVLQQHYMQTSNYITTLRTNNGDSAYVPTTTVYSGLFDEIVEPQQGTGASAFLKDARNKGVTNNYLQDICPELPAGSFYTHEGVLYNPIAYALVLDALKSGKQGQLANIDKNRLCNQYLADGLNVGDLLVTENAILVAALALVVYEPKVINEPAIKSYAK